VFRARVLGALLLPLLVFAGGEKLKAAHLIGGELSYTQVNDSVYVVQLKIYRDCAGFGAGFDNPAYLFLYDNGGAYLGFRQLSSPAITNIPIVSDDPCLSIPPGLCVQEGIYLDTLVLPPLPGGYALTYQRCCRNPTIDNIVAPGDVGSTYVEFIPGTFAAPVNSGPVFNNFPPVVLCADAPINFDHSATDLDGDSLVYSLCAPFEGSTPLCPRPAGPFTGAGCPDQPGPPPYVEVPYSGTFTGAVPLPATPALAIDPVTGLLTGTPTLAGQYVVGVCVQEYRDGVLLGTHIRDFQFNVVNCTPVVVASTPSVVLDCEDYTVSFDNLSTGATEFFWDFGVPGVAGDTSDLAVPPLFVYPDTGTYFLTLIANPGFLCADTAFATVSIYPTLVGGWDVKASCSGIPVVFTDTSTSEVAGNIDSWNWSLGDGTVLTDQSPTYQYADGGDYNVRLIVGTDRGCFDTITKLVEVLPGPDVDFFVPDLCEDELPSFSNLTTTPPGTAVSEWQWSFGNGDTSGVEDPVYAYAAPGTFDVQLVAFSANGCSDTANQILNVGRVPETDAGTGGTVDYLELFNLNGSGTGGGAPGDIVWTPGTYLDDPNAIDPVFTGWETTTFTLTITSEDGCSLSDTVTVFVRPLEVLDIPTAFSPNGDGMNDGFELLDNDIASVEYFQIYNRWGELVFQTNDVDAVWDGTYKGKPQDNGTYVWVLRATGLLGQVFEQRGTVTLVR
jgi:gliding motility-associated-like protein